ncbi:hypothetical protein [Shewanella sp. MBTL60-007]|uniref:hypothetical protein n=1 Tax=Shewanella sp. MBTL60-007 TaxID=2815911 RepID=UPI001BC3D0E6|nr:hypothetical protein [Shewanella sp. MBTL60-007]GIU19509.1 hypothetical protein TUM3792_17080 [Shewanella sp. MBTL60-007]
MTSVNGAIASAVGSAVGSAITASVTNTPVANKTATLAATSVAPLPNVGASTNVAISAGAQQKLADEQQAVKDEGSLPKADSSTPKADAAPEEEGGLESFVFGALGLDHPEEIDENGDPSYSAGQYVKAAATVGGMIAMFI